MTSFAVIIDSTGNYVLSNLGWVDDGRVWRFDASIGKHESIRLSKANYLYLSGNHQPVFTAVHHYEDASPVITAQTFAEPRTPVANITFDGLQGTMTGDTSVWQSVKTNFVVRIGNESEPYSVAQVQDGKVSLIKLGWFNANAYDLMYQGIEDVVEVADNSTALVSVQRSERLLVCDLDSFDVIREIRLPNEPGNAEILADANRAWLVNYDTVQSIDLNSWSLNGNAVDQDSRDAGMFLGSVWISADEQTAVVACPASSDVKVLNTDDMSERAVISIGDEPIEAVLLQDGRVVARDWQTGKLLTGVTSG